jgi:Tol biopolymer transport system component
MSVDVSPDGRTLVFDLVGDLYTLPLAGGTATRITDGMAFDAQPRWSPDGKQIAFVSDRSGSENLWTVEPDGKNPKAITKGDKAQYISPEWTPDGNYLVTSKTTTGILGSTYDLYLIHKDGGTGIKLTGQGTSSPSAPPPGPGNPPPYTNYLGAAFGNDPRYIYSAVKRGGFRYNQTEFEWQVAVYDRETGKTFLRTNANGAGMRPVLSPDGRWMVYATRRDSVTAYRLRDLASGDETWLAPNVQRDDQESRFTRDVMPGASFTPDSRALIANHHGKLWRIDVPSGAATQIPFSAKIDQGLGPKVAFEYRVNDSTLTVQQIRGARPSPDGKRLVFTALDKVWTMELPNGKPRRLTDLSAGEFTPAWSPDGRWIAFVTWNDEGGDVYRMRADGRGRPERLTRARAFYDNLAYSPDGARLVVARGPRQPRVEGESVYGVELMWMRSAGGELRAISPLSFFGQPHFTRDTARVFIYDYVDGLVSMRFDGTDRRAIVKVTGFVEPLAGPQPRPTPAQEILLSPNGDRVIADVDNGVYLIDVPYSGGLTPIISVTAPAAAPVPVRKITRTGGDWLGWRGDGRSFYYSLGHSFFSYDIAAADSAVRDSTTRADSVAKAKEAAGARGDSAGARRIAAADSAARARTDTAKPDTARAGGRPGPAVALTPRDSAKVAQSDTAKKAQPAYEPARIDVLITVPKDRPTGTVALLRGARIVTMKGNEVIEKGDILVRDNRIAAIGPSGSVTTPAGARTIDVAGKTIIPGWVDVHSHMWTSWGIHRAQVWEYMANLAYGVTTTRDPQTATTDVLSYGDLVETGDILGPRIYSTGPGVFWSDDLKSLEDTRDFLRRYSEFYNTHTIKQYMVGDRQVRQWVAMVCKELGLTPTLEGGLDFKKNLTEAIDGYAGSEHAYPIAPLYKDVVELIAESGITYTPTLLVLYGGPFGENYWYEQYDVLADPKLARFTPLVELQRRGLRRAAWFRNDQYNFPQTAAQAAKIVAAGGRVGLGGHGQLQGLGVHWELWSMALGGMSSHDVLRVGTIFGAESIGLGKDLGSLESGKLADLQVLDANPLENIRNTNTLRYVMKNGRLYEAETLKEIYPRERVVPTPWWRKSDVVTAAGGEKH